MYYVEKKITLVHANNLIILWWERNLKPSVAANVRMFYLKAFNIDSPKRSIQLKLCGVIIPFFSLTVDFHGCAFTLYTVVLKTSHLGAEINLIIL